MTIKKTAESKTPVSVLMVGNDLSVRGGIASVISQLLSHDWGAEGVQMRFVPTYIEAGDVKKLLFFVSAYRGIRKFIKAKRPDIVHIHMSYRGSFVRKYRIHRLCQRYRVLDVLHLHGSEFKKWYDTSNERQRRKIRALLKEASAVIVLGRHWEDIIKEIEPEAKTVVVSNTVHIPEKTVLPDGDYFQVLFLGVLLKRKGAADLLEAAAVLKDSGVSGLRYVIAGTGEEEGALRGMAKSLGLDDVVNFAGWVSGGEKEELFCSSKLLVLPSYNEGMPVSVLEAMSYGLPVVATDVGDVSMAVRDGINGYLITPGDTAALAESIRKTAEDRQRYGAMSKASREIAEESFSDEKYFEKIMNCYKACLEKR